MKKIALAFTSLLLAAPLAATTAFATDAPAFHRSVESGVQVYRGHVPRTDLGPIIARREQARQFEAARVDQARFQRQQIAAVDRQTAQFAALQAQIAGAQTNVFVETGRRNDFLFGGLFALDSGLGFGRPGYRNGYARRGAGVIQRDPNTISRFDRRGFSGRRNGLVQNGAFGAAGASGR